MAPGAVAEAAIVCHATGAAVDPGERVAVRGLTVRGATFSAAFREPPPAAGLALGESLVIDAAHRPLAEGLDQGSLLVETSAGPVEVSLAGSAVVLPPCHLRVTPASIDFGWLPPGAIERREVALRNDRTDGPCLVRAVRLAGCPGVVTLPDGPIAEARLDPGEDVIVPVVARASEPAEIDCGLAFTVPGDEAPERLVPLHGRTGPGCLSAMPPTLDFGVGLAGCKASERAARLHNGCTAPVTITAARVPEGDEFLIRSMPVLPISLPPGELVEVTVAYRPGEAGVDEGAFRFELDGFPAPVALPLHGEGVEGGQRVDAFDGLHRPEVDLLFVFDNGPGRTMAAARTSLGNAYFFSPLQSRDLDYHVGVTTTGLVPGGSCPGGAQGGEDGRLFPVDRSSPRIIDARTADREATFEQLLAVGDCHASPPQGMEAAMRAVLPPVADSADDPRHPEPADGNAGFLRERAHLRVILVTDRTDASPRTPVAYRDALLVAKGLDPGKLSIVAITGDAGTGCSGNGQQADPGDRLIELAALTPGGASESICAGIDPYRNPLLPPRPTGPPEEFCHVLTSVPQDLNGDGRIDEAGGEVEVRFDGNPVPAVRDDGTPAWSVRTPGNLLCFPPDALPPRGSEILVAYGIACLE